MFKNLPNYLNRAQFDNIYYLHFCLKNSKHLKTLTSQSEKTIWECWYSLSHIFVSVLEFRNILITHSPYQINKVITFCRSYYKARLLKWKKTKQASYLTWSFIKWNWNSILISYISNHCGLFFRMITSTKGEQNHAPCRMNK